MKWIERSFSWRKATGLFIVAVLFFLVGARWGGMLFGRTTPRLAGRAARPGLEKQAGSPGASSQLRPMPGEFKPQSGLILGCSELLENEPKILVDVIRATHRDIPVIGLVRCPKERMMGAQLLERNGLPDDAVRFVVLPVEGPWVRDYGPLFIQQTNGAVHVADGQLPLKDEGAGARHRCEDEAPGEFAKAMGLPVRPVPMFLVGGNLLSNGDGLCLSTTRLALYNRLLGHDPNEIGPLLQKHLGFKSWLCVAPLAREKTGHVDMFVTFTAPNVAVVGQIAPSEDPENARRLDETARALQRRQTSLGPIQVHRVPMSRTPGGYWRTYTNVVFANGTLLVPTYTGAAPGERDEVLLLYARLLSGWKIVGVCSDTLASHSGGLHCITRNVPAYVPAEALRRLSNGHRRRAPDTGTGLPLGIGQIVPFGLR